jgi:hypothetical protein
MKATRILLFTIIWLPVVLISCNKNDDTTTLSQETPSVVQNITVAQFDQMIKLHWLVNTDNNFLNTVILYAGNTLTMPKGADSAVITKLTNNTTYTFKLVSVYSGNQKSDTITVTGTPQLTIKTILANGLMPGNYFDPTGTHVFHFDGATSTGVYTNGVIMDTVNSTVTGYWTMSVAGVASISFARRLDNTNKVISRPSFVYNNAFTFVTDTATYFAYSVFEKNDTAKKLQGSYTSYYTKTEYNNGGISIKSDSAIINTTAKRRDVTFADSTWTYTETILKTYKSRFTGNDTVAPVQIVNNSQGTWSQSDIRSGKYVFATQDLKAKNRIFLISSFEKLYKKK